MVTALIHRTAPLHWLTGWGTDGMGFPDAGSYLIAWETLDLPVCEFRDAELATV